MRCAPLPERDLVVEVTVAAGEAELATDRLWAAGASAVEERSQGSSVVLVAGFPVAGAARAAAASLGGSLVEIDPASWRDEWKRHAQVVEVGSLLVAPVWRDVTVAGDRVVLRIDPGPCFGSGDHPTTRMLLAELARRVVPGVGVLDVGTGSGILAVAAAVLGAAVAVGVDIDPAAVEVAAANAAANAVSARVAVSTMPVEEVTGCFDLVVANLSAGVLAELAAALWARVSGGGLLLVSGLLPGQWAHIAGSFPEVEIVELLTSDGWTGAVMRRG